MRIVELDENTRMPLKTVFTLIGVIGGGMIWCTSVYSDVAIAKSDIRSTKEEITELKGALKALYSIDRRLSNIEGRLQMAPPAHFTTPKGD